MTLSGSGGRVTRGRAIIAAPDGRDPDRARGGRVHHHDLRGREPPLARARSSRISRPGAAAEQVVEALRTARQNAIAHDRGVPRDLHGRRPSRSSARTGHAVRQQLPANRPPDMHRGSDQQGATLAATPSEIRFDPKGSTLDRGRRRDHHLPERPPLAGGREHAGSGARVPGDRQRAHDHATRRGNLPGRADGGDAAAGVALMGLAAAFVPGPHGVQRATRRRRRPSWPGGSWRTCGTAPTTWAPMRSRRRTSRRATGYGTASGRLPELSAGRSPSPTTRRGGDEDRDGRRLLPEQSGVEQPVTLSMIFAQAS